MENLLTGSYWHNYITGDYDFLSRGPTTDEEAVKYIPQDRAAIGLFERHRLMGKSILESMVLVYTAYIGDKG